MLFHRFNKVAEIVDPSALKASGSASDPHLTKKPKSGGGQEVGRTGPLIRSASQKPDSRHLQAYLRRYSKEMEKYNEVLYLAHDREKDPMVYLYKIDKVNHERRIMRRSVYDHVEEIWNNGYKKMNGVFRTKAIPQPEEICGNEDARKSRERGLNQEASDDAARRKPKVTFAEPEERETEEPIMPTPVLQEQGTTESVEVFPSDDPAPKVANFMVHLAPPGRAPTNLQSKSTHTLGQPGLKIPASTTEAKTLSNPNFSFVGKSPSLPEGELDPDFLKRKYTNFSGQASQLPVKRLLCRPPASAISGQLTLNENERGPGPQASAFKTLYSQALLAKKSPQEPSVKITEFNELTPAEKDPARIERLRTAVKIKLALSQAKENLARPNVNLSGKPHNLSTSFIHGAKGKPRTSFDFDINAVLDDLRALSVKHKMKELQAAIESLQTLEKRIARGQPAQSAKTSPSKAGQR